ncbi:HIT family protein [Glycomyces sp. YM15]|uniref:HIT family protein n=1 Tax=Glycomyces sp. YM15 TaxID=2800446 RepID=UPI001963812E
MPGERRSTRRANSPPRRAVTFARWRPRTSRPDTPADAYRAVGELVREVAVAIRATYGCDGVSTRQYNEPAGNQDVWHLHVHVFPRYEGDRLYASKALPGWADAMERQVYAERLRAYFTSESASATGAR